MTEKPTTKTDSPENSMMGSLLEMRHLFDTNGTAVDAFVRSGEATLKGMVTINEEMMKFVDKRARASIDTCQSMVRCNTFAEAMELQSQYARATSEDYLAQAGKLLNLSAEMAKNGMAAFQAPDEESPPQPKK